MSRVSPLVALAVLGSLCTAGSAFAQESGTRGEQTASLRFNLPAQALGSALRSLASQANANVMFDEPAVAGKVASPLQMQGTLDEALGLLLKDTGLEWRFLNDATVVVGPAGSMPQPAASLTQPSGEGDGLRLAQSEARRDQVEHAANDSGDSQAATGARPGEGAEASGQSDADVVVTGTRILGATPTSPVVEISQSDIRAAGHRELGEVIRSLPINFSGGQNPGVRQGATGIADQNINGGSSINLRGIGPDATLTLLNGHRLSYDSFVQAVDISAIPIDAVSRVQVVPDGASAIYGSDAVAGVANIILKRDYEGVSSSMQLGGATEGGGFLQQYNTVGGTTWGTGGFLLAAQYGKQEPIRSSQRDYTEDMPRPADIMDYSRQYSGILTLHQELAPSLKFSMDALYNNRVNAVHFSPASPTQFRSRVPSKAWAIAPSLSLGLAGSWTAGLSAMYGKDKTDNVGYILDTLTGETTVSGVCYCNSARGVELDLEGPLSKVPGGDVRLATGGGYRENQYKSVDTTTGDASDRGTRRSAYAFAEVDVPLVSAGNAMRGLHGLSLRAAIRYEDYNQIGEVTTPKFGLIYSPSADVDLKATYGKSFKAPTLSQQYQSNRVYLFPAFVSGGSGLPPTATVLLPFGGSSDLEPERARTWSTSIELHPRSIEGLTLTASYFDIAYRDRVLLPVDLGTALSNPVFDEFIVFDPTAEQQAAAIAIASDGQLTNFAGAPYDPANVVAIVDDRYRNVARQDLHGVDTSVRYDIQLSRGTLSLNGLASWLRSEQQNSEAAPVFRLAGIVYNPPRFRARGGAAFATEALSASVFVNYTAGVTDNRLPQTSSGDSMTTVDATLIYRLQAARGALSGMELSLSAQNLLDEDPPYLLPVDPSIVPYDSTNYSSIGRFIAASVRKSW